MKTLYNLITIVITLYLLTSCSSKAVGENIPGRDQPEAKNKVLLEAELLFRDREDVEKLRSAITLVEEVRNPANLEFDTEYIYARYSYFLGKALLETGGGEIHLERGRDAARNARRLEPNRPEGHFWYAANLGELARKDPLTGFGLISEIRESMTRVIELEPGYEAASAFDALAQIEMGTRLTGGSPQRAVDLLEKGLTVNDQNPNIYIHLADALLALGRKDEARKYLELLITTEAHPEYEPEHKRAVAKAKKLLAIEF